MGEWDLDLLGDPVPEGLGKRGRPAHLVTVENRQKVMVLAGLGMEAADIALAIGITMPTLRKHYFRELRCLDAARLRLKSKAAMALVRKVEAGDTSAIALLFKRLDKQDLATLAAAVAGRGADAKPAAPKGKKAAMKEAAGKVKGIFAPPDAPRLIN
jgi:hypothetical protein